MTQSNFNIVRWNEEFASLLRPGNQPERLPAELVDLPENTCLALPADSVRTLPIPVAPDEVKHLRRALFAASSLIPSCLHDALTALRNIFALPLTPVLSVLPFLAMFVSPLTSFPNLDQIV